MPIPTRATLLGCAALALLIGVLGVRWLRSDARPEAPVRSPARLARGDAGTPLLQRAASPAAVVHVAGAVRRPGVYRLRAGSRVRDAVSRAGGASADADTAAVNLAAKLTDGQQVIVPPRIRAGGLAAGGAATGSGSESAATAAGGPVSLGSATLEQLDALDGVGPATAQKILDRRTQTGGFASVDDLGEIPGIGPKKLESLRRQLTP